MEIFGEVPGFEPVIISKKHGQNTAASRTESECVPDEPV